MHKFVAPCEIKANVEGFFYGYASIFSNVDAVGDVILPGAFKDFVRTKNGKTVVLMAHNSDTFPVGQADVTQDDRGLKFEAALNMDDPDARRLYSHLKAGTISGMSIGYDILPGGARLLDSGVRELSALRLWEISPVIFGANKEAQIQSVKGSDVTFSTPKELEAHLRDVGGFSRSQAKAIVACGFKGLVNQARDVPGLAANLERLSTILADFGPKSNL